MKKKNRSQEAKLHLIFQVEIISTRTHESVNLNAWIWFVSHRAQIPNDTWNISEMLLNALVNETCDVALALPFFFLLNFVIAVVVCVRQNQINECLL